MASLMTFSIVATGMPQNVLDGNSECWMFDDSEGQTKVFQDIVPPYLIKLLLAMP